MLKFFCFVCATLSLTVGYTNYTNARRGIPFPILRATPNTFDKWDAIVLVSHQIDQIQIPLIRFAVSAYAKRDATVNKGPSVTVIPTDSLLPGMLIYSSTGPVNRDFDDVRRFYDAGEAGIKRALMVGSKKPLVILPTHPDYAQASLATLLGVLYKLYTPLEVMEAKGKNSIKVDSLAVYSQDYNKVVKRAKAIEAGRIFQRDIMASDPIRMAPPKCAEFLVENFANSAVKVDVQSDQNWIEAELPCFAAVNRACLRTPEFHARLVTLTYVGEGPIEETLMFVGKGVTFDSGGIDVKTDGYMVGMHRDKGGAATVAGLFEVLNHLRPKNLKVIGLLPFVRNTIAPEGYTADEVITARSGKRIRVVNTDAEGRMIMVDCLALFKEMIVKENVSNAHLFSIATLTGHALKSAGEGFSIVIDNGPAYKDEFAQNMQKSAESLGAMLEVSRLRREDFDGNEGKTEYEDLYQMSNAKTRGHQNAFAFLISGSGLDAHGIESEKPLKYTHIDMAGHLEKGSIPHGHPVASLAATFLL